MITRFTPIVATLLLVGCGTAQAEALDPSRPSHCVAAFAYARYWMSQDATPKGAQMVRQMEARAAFELRGTTASERTAYQAEGERLIRAHAKHRTALDALFLQCGKVQDEDPAFEAFATSAMEKLRNGDAGR